VNKTTEIPIVDSETQASSVGEETAASTDNSETSSDGGLLPSYKQLIVFTASTILIWLSEPLLSLVDTTIVGLTASAKSAVVQIAALGPATTLFDSLIYTTYFLAISTTNQLAPGLAAAAAASSSSSVAKTANDKTATRNIATTANPWKELRRSTSHLLGLAIVFGSVVTMITYGFGRSIIGQMVGGATNMGTADASAIVPLANNYARIRAAVAPFSIVGFVAQSVSVSFVPIRKNYIAFLSKEMPPSTKSSYPISFVH
jgi:Na+-driven multidrug efflux pump